jgi:hypothetical protein
MARPILLWERSSVTLGAAGAINENTQWESFEPGAGIEGT